MEIKPRDIWWAKAEIERRKVVIVESDDGIEVHPLDERNFERFAGVLSGAGSATQALLDDRQRESE